MPWEPRGLNLQLSSGDVQILTGRQHSSKACRMDISLVRDKRGYSTKGKLCIGTV